MRVLKINGGSRGQQVLEVNQSDNQDAFVFEVFGIDGESLGTSITTSDARVLVAFLTQELAERAKGGGP